MIYMHVKYCPCVDLTWYYTCLLFRAHRPIGYLHRSQSLAVLFEFYETLMAVMPVSVPMNKLVPYMVGVTKRFADPTFNEATSCPLFILSACMTPLEKL